MILTRTVCEFIELAISLGSTIPCSSTGRYVILIPMFSNSLHGCKIASCSIDDVLI